QPAAAEIAVARPIHAVEALEDKWQMVGRNTGTRIGDRALYFVCPWCDADSDLIARRSVADRVVQQGVKDLRDAVGVRQGMDRRCALLLAVRLVRGSARRSCLDHAQRHLLPGGYAGEVVSAGAGEVAKMRRLKLQLEGTGIGARQDQEIVDQPDQPF